MPLYQQETEKIYGIKLDKLPSAEGKKKASEMFAIGEATTAENVVLVAIKPLDGNLDLQFETFGLINTVVSSFSSILD